MPDWCFEAVDWAVICEITKGTSDTTFSPNETCTTGQILTFMHRNYSEKSCDIPADMNPAISPTAYYYNAIAWADFNDLISAATVDPNAPCTRASVVTYLWKLVGSPAVAYDGRFTDVAADADYAQAVAWALENNITDGTSPTTFGPSETCTRGQIVTFLYRAYA